MAHNSVPRNDAASKSLAADILARLPAGALHEPGRLLYAADGTLIDYVAGKYAPDLGSIAIEVFGTGGGEEDCFAAFNPRAAADIESVKRIEGAVTESLFHRLGIDPRWLAIPSSKPENQEQYPEPHDDLPFPWIAIVLVVLVALTFFVYVNGRKKRRTSMYPQYSALKAQDV
jgi:hypothetical protein